LIKIVTPRGDWGARALIDVGLETEN